MTRCEVFINDNIIFVKIPDEVTVEDAHNIGVDAEPLLERSKAFLLGGLIDLSDIAAADNLARKELSRSLRKCSGYLKKLAVFAPDLKRRTVARIVLTMGGWRDFKMFSDREKALAWIKETE